MRLQKDAAMKVLEVMNAWERLRPHKRFFGLTLEDYKLRAKAFLDARAAIARLEEQISLEVSKRDAAAIPLIDLVQSIVSSVCGDPEEGHNGELYSAMGYVPKNQRATGLVRRRKATPPAAGGNG